MTRDDFIEKHNKFIGEIIPFTLFDTIITPIIYNTTISFFKQVSYKDGNDLRHITNMQIPNMLPSPQEFFIEGISIMCPIKLKGVFSLIIGQKIYIESYITESYLVDPIRKELGFDIRQGEPFKLDINPKCANHNTKEIRVELVGVLFRPIC